MTKKLGLPLEYQQFPQFFDAHNINEDTEKKNSVIEKILKKYQVNSVLDLTCGTGSQVFFLFKLGYKIIGSDFSFGLLKIARKKAKKEGLDVKFIDGDMRNAKVGKFDAVITMFNAIGHLNKSDFEKALKNISQNLKDGGIYIFDILNLEAMSDEIISDFSMQRIKKIDDTKLHSTQCSTIDRKNGLLTSYDYHIFQKKADKPNIIKNKFSLQIYTTKELREILARNGFAISDQYAIDGSKFLPKESVSILTVARSIK